MEELAKTSARRVSVHGRVNLEKLDGIKDLHYTEDTVSFLYGGDMNLLLGRLSEGDVSDLSVSEPDLEEIFLHYYQEGGGTQ